MTGWRMLKPTASALGVIAIVFVLITATLSEADSGTIESSINHPEVDEEDQHVQEEVRAANQSVADDPIPLTVRTHVANDTANEIPVTRDSQFVPTGLENSNDSRTNVVEPQRDQSGQSYVATATSNDVREPEDDPAGSEPRPVERNNPGNKTQHATWDFGVSTKPNRAEIVSSTDSWNVRLPNPRNLDQLDGIQVGEDLSNVVEHEGSVTSVDKSRRKDTVRFTTASIREMIATELRPLEQKNVDDIKAISFQVPVVETEEAVADTKRQQDNERARIVADPKKDNSRSMNNLLVTGGKSTKAFYEIKPSIKTEVEPDHSGSTLKPLQGRKFVLPSVDSALGKYGPYFEDGDEEMNFTARIGSTMLLDCKIGMLGDKEVTWHHQASKDSFRLLTVGRTVYSVDQRISLMFRYPSNWRLQIQYATPRDSGLYKCQVATHPPLVKTINVVVTAPELTITDDSGRVVPKERHLKAGSALKLRCEARDINESLTESVVWTRGDETLTDDVSENRTMEILAGREVLVIVSTLIVEKATPRHAGNYSCMVPGKAKTTIAVHVLNGELPAAVHDGNGVSRAFLNLWLIHLTMSYVFSR
ncbi:uncharacterized protein LOC108631670 [Ceratina calcarata]|uniref:Uncharacterized protein LOC108631670 n=1 Tax=Ceratina calcarata TaxID=156304 RepID=A0AAJ7JF51_9HYME|nr:uncharacterized protein LOC108631670 [Ceratina calcarata]XP_026674774.1 uncharacterized protein LOC108631670 [Ceratina calcarata]